MKIAFVSHIPPNNQALPILVLGEASIAYNKKEYLELRGRNRLLSILEIRYQCTCSPFNKAEIISCLFVGAALFHLFCSK